MLMVRQFVVVVMVVVVEIVNVAPPGKFRSCH
jgi:hypothetical protein